MSTAHDLVEANAYERRRLVAAFAFGGRGCPVPEPSRSGRTVLGALVLAGLLLGGAASAGRLGFRDPNGWTGPGLVVSDETGASYLILDEGSHRVLRPVLNATSAGPPYVVDAAGVAYPLVGPEAVDRVRAAGAS